MIASTADWFMSAGQSCPSKAQYSFYQAELFDDLSRGSKIAHIHIQGSPHFPRRRRQQ